MHDVVYSKNTATLFPKHYIISVKISEFMMQKDITQYDTMYTGKLNRHKTKMYLSINYYSKFPKFTWQLKDWKQNIKETSHGIVTVQEWIYCHKNMSNNAHIEIKGTLKELIQFWSWCSEWCPEWRSADRSITVGRQIIRLDLNFGKNWVSARNCI